MWGGNWVYVSEHVLVEQSAGGGGGLGGGGSGGGGEGGPQLSEVHTSSSFIRQPVLRHGDDAPPTAIISEAEHRWAAWCAHSRAAS